MRPIRNLTIVMGVLGVVVALSQSPPQRTGPGVQAPQDAKYADLIKTCKAPPPAGRGGGGGGKGGGKAPAAAAAPRDAKSTEIPGVIAAG